MLSGITTEELIEIRVEEAIEDIRAEVTAEVTAEVKAEGIKSAARLLRKAGEREENIIKGIVEEFGIAEEKVRAILSE